MTFLLILLHSTFVFAGDCQSALGPVQKDELVREASGYLERNVKGSRFAINRSLPEYLEHFNLSRHSLEGSLLRLNPESHVMDLGAGLFLFVLDYVTNDQSKRSHFSRELDEHVIRVGPSRVTGVTLVDTATRATDDQRFGLQVKLARLRTHPGARLFEGRFFEDIGESELLGRFGKVDVLIDYFGVLTYTLNLGLVIEKVARLMKPGAEIWMTQTFNRVQRRDGSTWRFGEYMARTGLFDIVESRETPLGGSVLLLRRSRRPARKIDLELVEFTAPGNGVPSVTYRER